MPDDLLAIGERPPLNVHPSLLPRHRGAAPVASTILAGDQAGGVSLMVMIPELDAGPIVAQWPVALHGRETTPELEAQLSALAAEVVPPELERWASGALQTEPQDAKQATLIKPFRRADGWLDWRKPAELLDRQVRALQPWPGAWTTIDGRRLHVRAAHPTPGIDGMPMGALLPGAWPEVATRPGSAGAGRGAAGGSAGHAGRRVATRPGPRPRAAGCWRTGEDRLRPLHRPRIRPSPRLGYTRHASKEVARQTMGGFLPYILLVFIPSIAITGWAAWRVRSTYAKWSKIDSGIQL